jgi:hypothetical protein
MEKGSPSKDHAREAEKMEGEIFWVSCNYCGFNNYIDMGEGSSPTKEDVIQAFWKEHDEEGRTGGINNTPCPSSDFKIENADDKKQFFRKKEKK